MYICYIGYECVVSLYEHKHPPGIEAAAVPRPRTQQDSDPTSRKSTLRPNAIGTGNGVWFSLDDLTVSSDNPLMNIYIHSYDNPINPDTRPLT